MAAARLQAVVHRLVEARLMTSITRINARLHIVIGSVGHGLLLQGWVDLANAAFSHESKSQLASWTGFEGKVCVVDYRKKAIFSKKTINYVWRACTSDAYGMTSAPRRAR